MSTPVRKTGFDKPRNPAPVRLAEQRLAAEAAYKARGPSNFSPERRTPSLHYVNAFGKEMCLLLGVTFPTMMVCVSRQPFVAGDGAVGKARDDGGGEGGSPRGAREGQSREGGFAGGGEEVPAFRAGE